MFFVFPVIIPLLTVVSLTSRKLVSSYPDNQPKIKISTSRLKPLLTQCSNQQCDYWLTASLTTSNAVLNPVYYSASLTRSCHKAAQRKAHPDRQADPRLTNAATANFTAKTTRLPVCALAKVSLCAIYV